MYAVNFEHTLSALSRQSPLRLFVVELVNRERIDVDHPEALSFRNMRAIFITKEGQAHYFDPEGVNRIVGSEGNGRGA